MIKNIIFIVLLSVNISSFSQNKHKFTIVNNTKSMYKGHFELIHRLSYSNLSQNHLLYTEVINDKVQFEKNYLVKSKNKKIDINYLEKYLKKEILVEDGTSKTFHSNGVTKDSCTMINGKIDNVFSFLRNGKLYTEHFYQDGKIDYIIEFYYAENNILTKIS